MERSLIKPYLGILLFSLCIIAISHKSNRQNKRIRTGMEAQKSPKQQTQQQPQQQHQVKSTQESPVHTPERLIRDNDFAIFYESPQSCKLVQIRSGDRYQTTHGAYKHLSMVNKPWGSRIQAFNKPGIYMYVLEPKSTIITETLARKTQILYSMDNSAIVYKLDIKPGSVVVEAGTGSGSLSCAICESLGDSGHLYTFEFNKERAEITSKFFQDLKKQNITSTWRDVVENGFQIEGKNIQADSLFLDVPNPWAAIHHTKKVLKKRTFFYDSDGRICCFSPCIEQVQRTSAELRKQRFIKVETVECLSRQIYEEDLSLQGPQGFKRNSVCSLSVVNNRGHTGYLTFAILC